MSMIFKKLSYVMVLSCISSLMFSMQNSAVFQFIARIQNQSRKTISYIHAKGEYASDNKEGAKLSQDIPHDNTLEIVRGKGKFTDMWLNIAEQKYALSSIATVFERVVSGSTAKTAYKGYQIKFDGQNVAQVIEGELVCVKISADNKISFEVQHDINYSLLCTAP